MIDSLRLKEISKLFGMRPWQQEKHYLQSLILSIISDLPIVFKGGTYLWMFHGLKRFSEDLDFTSRGDVRHDFHEFVSRSIRLYGYENEVKIIKSNEHGISVRFLIEGPLHKNDKNRCVIYVEISGREKTILPGIPLKLDFPQYDIPVKNLSGMNLDEVGSEKVRAILTREKARDIYDLYYLIRQKEIKLDTELINKKLAYYGKRFDSNRFMQELESRGNLYSKTSKPLVFGEMPDFDEVVSCVGKWVNRGPINGISKGKDRSD
jgi:predicted nucleotidyltransferase component of viral defense system